MSFTSEGGIGGGSHNNGDASTRGFTTTAVAAVGKLLLLFIADDNNTTGTSDSTAQRYDIPTDGTGGANTWFFIGSFLNAQSGQATGGAIEVWGCVVTTQINSGNTISYTPLNSAIAFDSTSRLWMWSISAGSVSVAGAIQTLADDGADPGSMSISGLSSKEYLFVRAHGAERETINLFSPTTNFTTIDGNVSNTGGIPTANCVFEGEFRINTSTGETSDPTSEAADTASIFFALAEGSDVVVSPPQGNLVLSTVAPDVAMPLAIEVPAGNLLISTSIPSSVGDSGIEVPAANLALSTIAPSPLLDFNVQIPSGNLILTTSVAADHIVPDKADLIISTSAPSLAQTANAAAAVTSGNLRLTSSTPVVQYTIRWSINDPILCPTRITAELASITRGGPRSLTGKKQAVQSDAGYWRVTVGGIRLKTNADILAWRERQLLLDGRANTILISMVDYKRAPIPVGGGAIIATCDDPVARGAVNMNLKMTQGSPPEPGMHFSVGERGYRIRSVGAPTGDVYPITFRPPTREAIADNAAVEFDNPMIRCRLETDDAMNIDLHLMRHARPSVTFVEDY